MILALFIGGLALALAVALGASKYKFPAMIALIIGVFVFSYISIKYYSDFLGYSVSKEYVDGDKPMIMIHGFIAGDKVYLLVFEQNSEIPRLISLPRTKQSEEDLQKAKEKQQKMAVMIILNSKTKGTGLKKDGEGQITQSFDSKGIDPQSLGMTKDN